MDEREAIRDALSKNPKAAARLADLVKSGTLRFEQPEENEEVHVICVRWPGMFDGCTPETCATCGMEVAVAPSTRDMVRNQKVPVFYQCIECASLPTH